MQWRCSMLLLLSYAYRFHAPIPCDDHGHGDVLLVWQSLAIMYVHPTSFAIVDSPMVCMHTSIVRPSSTDTRLDGVVMSYSSIWCDLYTCKKANNQQVYFFVEQLKSINTLYAQYIHIHYAANHSLLTGEVSTRFARAVMVVLLLLLRCDVRCFQRSRTCDARWPVCDTHHTNNKTPIFDKRPRSANETATMWAAAMMPHTSNTTISGVACGVVIAMLFALGFFIAQHHRTDKTA